MGRGTLSRRVLLAACAVGLALPAPAGAHWRPHVRSAVRYVHRRLGEVRFQVRYDGRKWGFHSTSLVRSASVVKAMLLVAYLNDPRVRHRRLRHSDRELIDPMIRRSDNTAASRVLAFVGPARVRAVARQAHMRRFSLNPVYWGGSEIDADDQARFFLHIDQRVTPHHRAAAMHLLASVIPAQRWGIGQVKHRGWKLYFKGGWGSGTGAVDHQVALLMHGRQRLSVAVLTTDSPSHEYGEDTLRGVFARLLHTLPARAGSS